MTFATITFASVVALTLKFDGSKENVVFCNQTTHNHIKAHINFFFGRNVFLVYATKTEETHGVEISSVSDS
jgi:hypothetical protein